MRRRRAGEEGWSVYGENLEGGGDGGGKGCLSNGDGGERDGWGAQHGEGWRLGRGGG